MKKGLVILMIWVMTMTIFAGCQKQDQEDKTSEGKVSSSKDEQKSEDKEAIDPYEIKFVIPGDAADDMDVVLDEFYKRTKENLNVELSFIYTGWDDIGQKVSLMISAAEKLDSAFLAQWTAPDIGSVAINEQLLNLDKYFHNDDYPGLKAAFSEEYLSTNKFIGPDGEYHIYGIPFSHSYDQGKYFYYRKDLADKYGITVNSMEDLVKFWDMVLENEPGMTPLSYLGSQNTLAKDIEKIYMPKLDKHNIGAGTFGDRIIIKDDGTAYVSRSLIPANDPEYRKYLDDAHPAKADPLWNYKIAREWYEKGYLDKDILSQKDQQGPFLSGRAASYLHGADVYNTLYTQLKESSPEAELGYFIAYENFRQDNKGQIPTTFQAWNFATIPVTCEDPDRVMKFYDWIFSSQENLDLLEYGVEGKHWTAVGDSKYTPQENPDTGKSYNFGAYVMTWNPTMYRISSDLPDDVVAFIQKNSDQEYFYKSPSAGFSFLDEEVKTEQALVSEVTSYDLALGNGVVEDIEGEVARIDADLLKAGMDTLAAAYEEQFNEFLKVHPYEAQ